VPILFVVGALSAGAHVFGPDQVGIALATGIGALTAIVIVGRLLLRPLFRWVAAIDSREVFIAAALLAVIGMSFAAQSAGLSLALGAFLAGMLLADTEFRHQIETDLEPFKDLLLGLFFVTVGMQIDLRLLLAQPGLIAAAVAALFALKALIIAPLARAFGMPWPRAIELAFLLGQVGEFAFIVVAVAQQGGVIPDATAETVLLITALSIFVTPALAWFGRQLARPFDKGGGAPADAAHASGHVVIAGCGRVGQMLSDILQAQDMAHVGVDADSDLIALLRKDGRPFHFGDASRRDVLEKVGAARAAAIVVTLNRPDAVERIVRECKAAWPEVPVYARAHDAEHAGKLRKAGADMASPDTVEAALQLGEALLEGCGVPRETALAIVQERRDAELAKAVG
jgi:CPA2 family monovalent cation:H+ antiporter-2